MPTPLVANVGPINISATNAGQFVASGHLGSFKASNNNWYAVYSERDSGSLKPQVNIYKSTDDGAAWALLTTGPQFNLYCCASRQGDIIYVAYEKDTDDAILTDSYDMIAEAYNGTNDPSIAIAGDNLGDQAFNIAATAGGDILLSWTDINLAQTTAECYYKFYTSGSWSGATHINAGVDRGVSENILTVGTTFGIFWSNWAATSGVGSSNGTRVSLFYSIVTAGALGVAATALLDASKVNDTTLSWPVLYPGIYDSGSDSVAFPILEESNPHTPGSDVCTMTVLVGTPMAAPVFTAVAIHTTNIGDIVSSPRLAGPIADPFTVIYAGFPVHRGFFAATMPPTEGLFVLLWALDDGGGTTTYQNSVSTSLGSGWSAPGQFLDTGVATSDTDPQYFFWINAEASESPGTPTATLYTWPPILLGSPTPPPGTFSAGCPSPIYIVGTPYDSFVIVTGGTGPYTFAVTSGSLPTGLSLNASTGEITGTPSATGPFSFTITVTDSTGATASTGSCSAGRCPGTRSII